MKKISNILLPVATLVLLGISGDGHAEPFARLKDDTLKRLNVDSTGNPNLQRLTVFQNKAFEFNQDTYLEGIDEQNISSLPSRMLFKKGTVLNVIKTRTDTSGLEWAQVYTDREDEYVDSLPAIVWVPLEHIMDSNVVMIDLQDPFDEDGNEIAMLEETTVMEFMINGKKKKVVRRRGGMTYCYRFVKMRLIQLGLVKSKLPGGSAYMAASILPQHGFSRTGRGPASAQINDVCVYSGGTGGHGHIEIKTARGWWYGYGYKSSPIRGRGFIACFSK